MGTTLDDLYEHEGYAARKLPDGTLTGTWSAATKEFLAFVPACSCSLRGYLQSSGEDEKLTKLPRLETRIIEPPRKPSGQRRAAFTKEEKIH